MICVLVGKSVSSTPNLGIRIRISKMSYQSHGLKGKDEGREGICVFHPET